MATKKTAKKKVTKKKTVKPKMALVPNDEVDLRPGPLVRVENLPAVSSPLSMMQTAQSMGTSPELLEKYMSMQFKWEENEARKGYMKAVSAFKAAKVTVTKDKVNSQFQSMYTGIGNLVNTVNPELSKYGLNAHWEVDQSAGIAVTCILSHALGYSERTTIAAPPDSSGSKNPIQEIKSTITYLKIATYEAITGVASTDDPGDTDGHITPSTEVEVMASKEQIDDLLDLSKGNVNNQKKWIVWAIDRHSVESLYDLNVTQVEDLKKGLIK